MDSILLLRLSRPAFRRVFSLFLASSLVLGAAGRTDDAVARRVSRSSEEVFLDMLESTFTGQTSDQYVIGTEGKFTFGAEKEASSSLLTRVMGPNKTEFKRYIQTLTPESQVLFLRDLLGGWIRGSYRVRGVTDVGGKNVDFQFNEPDNSKIARLDGPALLAKFDRWLELAGDRSFSFITPGVRRKIFNGELSGQNGKYFGKKVLTNYSSANGVNFHGWLPLYGEPEKYIRDVHGTSVGWEINFKPMPNYGEFEKMRTWFSTALRNAGEDFGDPGHQRLVFPKRGVGDSAKLAATESKLAEIYKNMQAYILLRSQEGRAGVEVSYFKSVLDDATLRQLGNGTRGIIRLESDRFGQNTYAIEFRGGTKSDGTRRFVQTSLVSRYAADDFEGIADSVSWTLVDDQAFTAGSLVTRFGIPRGAAEAAIANMTRPKLNKGVRGERKIGVRYLTPLWHWENAPYLSAAKKAEIRELTRSMLLSVAAWKNPSITDVQSALETWSKASNLSHDIQKYIGPRVTQDADLQALMEFPVAHGGGVDVNAIDLGIEYTARFPIKLKANYVEGVLQTQKNGWLRTDYDLTPDERKGVLKSVADALVKELDGRKASVTYSTESTHGNSLEMAYEFKDSLNRTVRVEWDGIGRDYDSSGQVIAGSPRGGHIEVVTPKFNPSAAEVSAIFRVFDKLNLIPSARSGGGHINIDLAPFAGKPEALARFMSIFHAHRGVIALMFQHPGRLRSAEPLEISDELAARLRNFEGTEADLKKMLYDERYFNTRLGRKTRYSQLDLSAYFQDVIPAELIHEDFDIKNAVWRKNFTVDPKIRKAEFRLFNAPADEIEAALQIRLVRALLNYALNPGPQRPGGVQAVDFEKYIANPDSAFTDLIHLCDAVGLDPALYRRYLIGGLSIAKSQIESEQYEPLSAQLRGNPKQEGWGEAVPPRSDAEGIASEGRVLETVPNPDPDALRLLEARRADATKMERIRGSDDSYTIRSGTIAREKIDAYLDGLMRLPNRGTLPDDDALMLIFRNLEGEHAKKARWALEKMSQSYGRMDQAIANALDRHDGDFDQWLFSLLKPGTRYPILEGKLVRDPRLAYRSMGHELMKGLAVSQVADTIVKTPNGNPIPYAGNLERLKLLNPNAMTSNSRKAVANWLTQGMLASRDERLIRGSLQILLSLDKQSAGSAIGVLLSPHQITLRPDVAKIVAKEVLSRPAFDTSAWITACSMSGDSELREIGYRALARATLPGLTSTQPAERATAFRRLVSGGYGDGKIQAVLGTHGYESGIPAIRREHYQWLMTYSSQATSARLSLANVFRRGLSDHEEAVRDASEKGFKSNAFPEFSAAIEDMLTQHDPEIRRVASRLLIRGSSSPLDLLQYSLLLASDSDPVVRENARKAIVGSTQSEVLTLLLEGKHSASPAVARDASELIAEMLALPAFDVMMSQAIGKDIHDRSQFMADLLAILDDPRFKGRMTIAEAVNSANAEIHELGMRKLRSLENAELATVAVSALKPVSPALVIQSVMGELESRHFDEPTAIYARFQSAAIALVMSADCPEGREAGITLLSRIPGASMLHSLDYVLSYGTPEARLAAAQVFAAHRHDAEALSLAQTRIATAAPEVARYLQQVIDAHQQPQEGEATACETALSGVQL